MGSFEYSTYVKFTANVDADMGWTIDKVLKCNGVVANWWVNVTSVAIETDEAGTPLP